MWGLFHDRGLGVADRGGNNIGDITVLRTRNLVNGSHGAAERGIVKR
jgi:hypothetical protein